MDKIAPGRYVVAVSGGLDSMVLLDMLRGQKGLELIVAHANHGQRPDAPLDTALVRSYCRAHTLRFVTKKLALPPKASESAARTARWEFLRHCSKKNKATAIITAHHQNDLIETALIALLRGTGWRGLAPFVASCDALRPLLNLTKNDLIAYARRNHIPWREDTTNSDQSYLRNYIRHTFMPVLDQKSDTWRVKFLQHICKQQQLRQNLLAELDTWMLAHTKSNANQLSLPRYQYIMLPSQVGYEVIQHILWRHTGRTLLRQQAEAAVLFTKTARPGKLMQLDNNWQLRAESANVIVEPRTNMLSLNKH